MLGFGNSYEICNCKKITIAQLQNAIIKEKISTLARIQDITTAGTECMFCIFPEGDFGKIKKKIYCKDILDETNKGLKNE